MALTGLEFDAVSITSLLASRVLTIIVGSAISSALQKIGLEKISEATHAEIFGGSIADVLKGGAEAVLLKTLERLSEVDNDLVNTTLTKAAIKSQLVATLLACRAALKGVGGVAKRKEEKIWLEALVRSLQERINSLTTETIRTSLNNNDILVLFNNDSSPTETYGRLVKKLETETFDLIRTDVPSLRVFSLRGFRLLEEKIRHGWEEQVSPVSPIKKYNWFNLVCGCFDDEYHKPEVSVAVQKLLDLETSRKLDFIVEQFHGDRLKFEEIVNTISGIQEGIVRSETKLDSVTDFLRAFHSENLDLLNSVLTEVSELRKEIARQDPNDRRASLAKIAQLKGLPTNPQWTDLLRRILTKAVPSQLNSIDILDRLATQRAFERIHNDPSYTDRFKTQGGIELPPPPPTSSGFLGVLDAKDRQLLSSSEPLEIVLSTSLMGAAAILFCLREFEHLNIELNFSVSHSVDILTKLDRLDISPQACVIGNAQYVHLRNRDLKAKYDVLSLMPPENNHIVVSSVLDMGLNGPPPLDKGDYLLLADQKFVSTTLFAYEQYLRQGMVPQSVLPKNLEPDAALADLIQGNPDSRHMLWSLQRMLAEDLGVAQRIKSSRYNWDTFLVFKRSLMREKSGRLAQALNKAIRSAWIYLYMNPKNIARVIEVMLADGHYVEIARRISGAARLGITD
jgi:hypothetical protein